MKFEAKSILRYLALRKLQLYSLISQQERDSLFIQLIMHLGRSTWPNTDIQYYIHGDVK